MNFRTAYSEPIRYTTEPGSRMANDYEVQLDKKGHKKLVKIGEHDIYEEIQSYLEETKIENILARAAAGDIEALNARNGAYADITDAPATLAEAHQMIISLENKFKQLPQEIRNKFNNSEEEFVAEFGSKEFFDKMGITTENAPKSDNIDFVPGTTETINEVLTPEEK